MEDGTYSVHPNGEAKVNHDCEREKIDDLIVKGLVESFGYFAVSIEDISHIEVFGGDGEKCNNGNGGHSA